MTIVGLRILSTSYASCPKLRVLAFASIIDLTDEPRMNVARLDFVRLRPLIEELKRGTRLRVALTSVEDDPSATAWNTRSPTCVAWSLQPLGLLAVAG
jgi:hypothetical protein